MARRPLAPPRDEVLADLFAAMAVQVGRFDPDRRNPRVQIGLERDLWHTVWLRWRQQRRDLGSSAQLARTLRGAEVAVVTGQYTLDELLGPVPGRPPATTFDDDDRAEMEAVLRALLDRRVVDAREFRLLRESRVHGRRIDGVARELGMTLAGARKVIQRAAPRVRAALRGGEEGGEDAGRRPRGRLTEIRPT